MPYPEKELGPAKALILLMAVVLVNKSKVQPVMDFRELSGFIDVLTANADIGVQKVREWQRAGSDVAIFDLKKA